MSRTDLASVLLSIRRQQVAHRNLGTPHKCLCRGSGKFKDEYDTGVATDHQEVTDHGNLHLPPLVIQRSCQFLD